MNNSCKLWGGLAASSPGMFPLFLGRSSLMVGGAVDIVVVQQEDGSFKSSPWFVRFSKLHGVLNVNEKVVNISVEPDFPMYMNHKGQAFFLREVHSEVHSVIRANTPTSEQLASLNLKEGRNKVTFSFSTAMLVTQQVEARIYLWKWNTRIVISDVDGTITRSDVRGQFMPMIGIDWSQTGVAHLFSAIQENGYQLLFLSARAISQACHTRQYLFNLKQDGKVLPDGPVVISPDGLIPALYREVIRRAPHEFKIKCLEGEIAVNRCHDTKSYTSLHAVVNGMFPPTNSSEQLDSWKIEFGFNTLKI